MNGWDTFILNVRYTAHPTYDHTNLVELKIQVGSICM